MQIRKIAWIISGPRLVQTQDASSEDVCIIPRIQGSEVAIPCPPPPTFPQGNGMFEFPTNYQNCLDYSSAEIAATARQQFMR